MAPAETAQKPKGEGDSIDDSRMTLGEHLNELRVRVMRSALAFVVAVVVLYVYREPVMEFVRIPHSQAAERLNDDLKLYFVRELASNPEEEWEEYFSLPELEVPHGDAEFSPEDYVGAHGHEMRLLRDRRFPEKLQVLEAGGPFVDKIKVAVMLALFIAGPVFLWEMWMFIAAGLYQAERKIVYSFFPVMLALFGLGVSFGFYYMVPNAIYFLQADGIATDGLSREMSLGEYLKFLRGLSLALGIVFQLPVIQVVLSKTGLVDPKLYAQYRGHMAIAALVIAMFLTPPDPYTQLLLAGPAIVLWEVGYWVSRLFWTPPPVLIPEEELTGSEVAT
ncbi:Sec-independent protein translocase protein TatC [Planctomycetes bacterium Poly30]|uniref:Sec-independent protein translocase protein TatC n=1 Tax=Saltatorellus ferox TaxID=2528018 RepID=A0A518EWL7_9BACT|nr:Sec-independent protein translocase protein TatC [Planctomycetes bacterium Poly30]